LLSDYWFTKGFGTDW